MQIEYVLGQINLQVWWFCINKQKRKYTWLIFANLILLYSLLIPGIFYVMKLCQIVALRTPLRPFYYFQSMVTTLVNQLNFFLRQKQIMVFLEGGWNCCIMHLKEETGSKQQMPHSELDSEIRTEKWETA